MENAFPTPKVFMTQNPPNFSGINTNHQQPKKNLEMYEDDIVDSFGPYRLPPNSISPQGARKDLAGGGIADLITPKGAAPPAMVEVGLSEPRFKSAPDIAPR